MGQAHVALTFREGRAVMARSRGRCATERPPHNLKDGLEGCGTLGSHTRAQLGLPWHEEGGVADVGRPDSVRK